MGPETYTVVVIDQCSFPDFHRYVMGNVVAFLMYRKESKAFRGVRASHQQLILQGFTKIYFVLYL